MPPQQGTNGLGGKLVEDIMVPLEEYPCISETLTLLDAITEIQVQIRVRGQTTLPRVALVFDETLTELLGMLRRRDIMRGLEPEFLGRGSPDYRQKLFSIAIDPNLAELPYEKIVAQVRARAKRLVREFMIPIRATITHDDHIMKAIYEMVDQNVSLLPVLKDDDVVGVVRSVDVLNEIALILSP
jgi:CBS domain containing-hemolysin-like protein